MNTYINILSNHCQLNKYFSLYVKICERAFSRQQPKISEKHHILPRCFKQGGYTDVNNLVHLTPKEHFICHKLLTKCVTDSVLKSKLTYAVWQFTKRYSVSAREYNRLKEELSLTYKNIPKSEEHKLNLRKPKQNTSKMGRPKGCSNPTKGIKRPHVGKNISAAKKGKNIGIDNHFYGKKHSSETIEKLKKINTGKFLSEETRMKMSLTRKDRTPWNAGMKTINNGLITIKIKQELLDTFLTDGWMLGKL